MRKFKERAHLLIVLAILSSAFLVSPCLAQKETPATALDLANQRAELLEAELSATKSRYELERQGLVNQAEMLKLKSQINEARYPMGEGKGLSPGFETDANALFHHIQAVRALNDGLIDLAKLINDKTTDVIILTDPQQIEALELRSMMLAQIAHLNVEFEKLKIGETVTVGFTENQSAFLAAKSYLSNAQDVFNFFATSTEIKYEDVVINEQELVSVLAACLNRNGRRVHIPLLPLKPWASFSKPDSLEQNMRILASSLASAEIELEVLKAKKNGSVDDAREIVKFKSWIDNTKSILDALSAKKEKSPLRLVDELARLSWHDEVRNEPTTQAILIKMEMAGGTTRVVKSAFSSGKMSFSGGFVLSYVLLDGSNQYVTSGVKYGHIGWQRIEDIRRKIPRTGTINGTIAP